MIVTILKALYPWGWITWFLVFAILEIPALILHAPQYTLSDFIWRLEEINKGWTFARYLVASLSLFVFLHLTFGILR